MKKLLLYMMMLTIGFTLIACGNEGVEKDLTYERNDISITHEIITGAELAEGGTNYDTTGLTRTEVTQTFSTNPTRVAIYSYDALDMLSYVGLDQTSINMLGVAKSNLPQYLSAFDNQTYANVGTLFLPDFNELDLFQPELIIIGARTTGAYDALKEQYPNADILDMTLISGMYSEGLTRNAENLAAIFPTVADAINNQLTSLLNRMADIQVVAAEYEALFIMVNGQSLSFFGPNGRFSVLHDEFGFDAADDAVDQGGSHGDVVSYEYVSAVNPEVIFLLDRAATLGDVSTIDEVIQNSLIDMTIAGQNDMIYTLHGEAWYLSPGGFTSTEQMILDLEPFLLDIA